MKRSLRLSLLGMLALPMLCLPIPACAADLPQGSEVYFENLKDGQEVTSPTLVKMGVKGLKVAPAGNVVEGEGHHHIIIDGGAIASMGIIPMDESHIHFGKGQTEALVPLKPGKHTLTLQFADGAHRSYGPALSKTITVIAQ